MNRLGEKITTAGRERQFTLSLILMFVYLIFLYITKTLWYRMLAVYCLWIALLLLPALLPRLRSEKPELKLVLLFAVWVLLTRALHWDVKAYISRCFSGDLSYPADTLHIASSAMVYVPMAACLILRGRDRERLIDGIAIVAVSFAVIVGLICLYGSLYKMQIPALLGDRDLCVFAGSRLCPLGKNPNTGCMWFFLGIFFSAYLFCRTGNRLCRVGLVLAAFLSYLMLTMTFSRNGMLAFSVCAGLLVLVLVLRRFSPGTVVRKLLCTVLVLGLTVPLAYGSFRLTAGGMESISNALIQKRIDARAQTEEETGSAGAELSGGTHRAAPTVLRGESSGHRDGQAQPVSRTLQADDDWQYITYEDSRGFRDSGRIAIYKSIVYTMQREPMRLLIGCLEENAMEYTNEILPSSVAHFHNTFLQILCVTGVVGLALVLIFCVLLGRRVIRVLYSDAPMTVSILALMLVGIVSYNMLEVDLFLYSDITCFSAYIAAGAVLAYTCEHDKGAPAAAPGAEGSV